jgi:hypothetical protein
MFSATVPAKRNPSCGTMPSCCLSDDWRTEPEEVRVELVAQVVLDAESLPTGDATAAGHQARAYEAERDDRRDLEGEKLLVGIAFELVDDDPIRTGTRIPAICDPIARSEETTSDARYGRRNPRRRTNVWRAGFGRFVASSSSLTWS